MSILKPLGFTDVSLNTREVQKDWIVESGSLEPLNITFSKFIKPDNNTPPEDFSVENRTYQSIQHLYYSNYLNDENTVSGSFENYLQTSLDTTSREIKDEGEVLNIPKNIFGNNLVPGSIEIKDNRLFRFSDSFTDEEEVTIDHNLNTPFPFTAVYNDLDEQVIPETVKIVDNDTIKVKFPVSTSGKVVVLSSDRIDVQDTGTGKLVDKLDDDKEIGDVIYTHGNLLIQDKIISETVPENIHFENQISVTLEHKFNDFFPLMQVYNEESEQVLPDQLLGATLNSVIAVFPFSTPASGTLVAGRTQPEFKYIESKTFSTGDSREVTFEHNLGTRDVIVQVFDTEGTRKIIIPKEVKIKNKDEIQVNFVEENSNQFTVAVYTGEEQNSSDTLVFPSVNGQLLFTTSYTLNTLKTTCKILPKEFNFTNNPSAKNIQDENFSPYITSVGLYNDLNQLVAVGKVSKPIPKSDKISTTFEISIDI